jgi:hypothetical protein
MEIHGDFSQWRAACSTKFGVFWMKVTVDAKRISPQLSRRSSTIGASRTAGGRYYATRSK